MKRASCRGRRRASRLGRSRKGDGDKSFPSGAPTTSAGGGVEAAVIGVIGQVVALGPRERGRAHPPRDEGEHEPPRPVGEEEAREQAEQPLPPPGPRAPRRAARGETPREAASGPLAAVVEPRPRLGGLRAEHGVIVDLRAEQEAHAARGAADAGAEDRRHLGRRLLRGEGGHRHEAAADGEADAERRRRARVDGAERGHRGDEERQRARARARPRRDGRRHPPRRGGPAAAGQETAGGLRVGSGGDFHGREGVRYERGARLLERRKGACASKIRAQPHTRRRVHAQGRSGDAGAEWGGEV
eukprot:scaffold5343_cov48-Phaeocystis_antarctica.AAC.5